MKLKNKSPKTIALSSLTALTLVGGVAAVALSSNVVNERENNKLLRSFSPNQGKLENLTNPDELFYASPILSATNNPIYNQSGQVNQQNVDLWNQFSLNIEKLPTPTSLPSQVAQEVNKLKNIGKKIKASIKLSQELVEKKDAWTQEVVNNPILSDLGADFLNGIWENQIKPEIINKNPDGVEDINDIPGINNIQDSLLIISGIMPNGGGHKIASISNPAQFQERNLSGQNAAPTNIGINNVAGANYKQLVKIAEIDPSKKAGTFVISFEYRESKSSIATRGKIYIKNDANQLANAQANVDDLSTKLDIFGRWDGSNIEVGQGAYKKQIDNFIVQYNNTTSRYEVLVRVNAQETLQNIRFETVIEGVTSELVEPSSFGILDVQATDNKTFLGTIKPETNVTKLVENIDDKTKVVNSIQFFSNNFKAIVNDQQGGAQGILKNRKLEFYQGPSTTPVTLGLNYASQEDNPKDKNEYNYSPVYEWKDGIDTRKQISIELVADGQNPSRLAQQEYDLYKDYVSSLPKNDINDSNFEQASTITLSSNVDTNSKLTRQSFLYSDRFYALGNPANSSYDHINVTGPIVFQISDPTQKIFFEKPIAFTDPTTQPEESTMKANKTINAREKVISLLSDLYREFGNSATTLISGDFVFSNPVNVWSAKGSSWGSYTNFVSKQQTINGSANAIYNALNSNWNYVSSAEKQMFGFEGIDKDKYNVKNAQTVVEKYLCAVTEFTSNGALIDQIIQNSIDVITQDQGQQPSESLTLDQLKQNTRNALAANLVLLIENQFTTINNEFQAQSINAVFTKISGAMASQTLSASLKPADELFELITSGSYNNLISYKAKAWENMSSGSEVVLSEATKTLFDVLYFNNGNQYPLGTSIFMSLDGRSAFKQLDSEVLTSRINSADNSTKRAIVKVYNEVLKRLGSEAYDLQASLNKMLVDGKALSLNFNIEEAIKQVINNIISGKRVAKVENDTNVSSFYLDDVISGTNILIALSAKQQQLGGGTTRVVDPSTIKEKDITPANVMEKINEIINGNSQYNSFELGQWADVVNGDPNYSSFTEALSGRLGTDKFNSMIEAITNDRNILAKTSIQDIAPSSVIQLEKVLKQLWWIVVALVGAGVLVVSSVAIATKDRRVKLSSRPVLKWLLVSGIVLGMAVCALAIVLGILL